MTDNSDPIPFADHGQEERYIEYKSPMIWTGNDLTKVKIAKAMMAMSNLHNGGVVIIGMREISRGTWQPQGLSDAQLNSFTQDDIASWVNDFAVPAVQFTVKRFEYSNNKMIAILVREFNNFPIICRKQKSAGQEVLESGAIYYRSNKKYESAPLSSLEDMAELINLAVYKGIAQEVTRLRSLNLIGATEDQKQDEKKFEDERSGL